MDPGKSERHVNTILRASRGVIPTIYRRDFSPAFFSKNKHAFVGFSDNITDLRNVLGTRLDIYAPETLVIRPCFSEKSGII